MKKTNKIFALLTGAAISIGMMAGLKAEAEAVMPIDFFDVFEMSDLNSTPNDEEFEEFRNTELYNKYKSYFSALGPYIYRSKSYPTIFYYYSLFGFNKVELNVEGKGEQWREIYDKYKDKLNWDEPYTIRGKNGYEWYTISASLGDRFSPCLDLPSNWNGIRENSEELDFSADVDFSDIEARAQELYDTIPEKYPIIMEMIAEMKEADCINSAYYTPFRTSIDFIRTHEMRVYDYKGTDEEFKSLIRSKVSGNPTIMCGTGGAEPLNAHIVFINLDDYVDNEDALKTGGTTEDYFAVYEMFKGMEKEMGLRVEIKHSFIPGVQDSGGGGIEIEDNTASSKTIDCFAVLDSAGDVNIDGRLGIQDIIAMHKNISDLIIFNNEQLMAADMNYDGVIDMDDLSTLMHRIID